MSESAPVTVYGIDNCDKVRAARRWLREHGIAHAFHDFRRDGLPAGLLANWLTQVSWQSLLNRRGRAWRSLAPEVRTGIVDETTATAALLSEPLLVQRPVLAIGEQILIGPIGTGHVRALALSACASPAQAG